MTQRIPVALATLLVSMFIALPAIGQSVAAPAPVDLSARLEALESDPRQLETALKAGSKLAGFCANCHGDGGNSAKPDVPNLAGQNIYYLLDQMLQITDGRRKSSDFKKRLIKVLSPDEKIHMIAFYARQEVAYKPSTDAAMVNKGKAVYQDICAECHKDDGRGTKKNPRVAGQQIPYMSAALKGYRDGSGARVNRKMAVVIEDMTDADIEAVALYVSAMK